MTGCNKNFFFRIFITERIHTCKFFSSVFPDFSSGYHAGVFRARPNLRKRRTSFQSCFLLNGSATGLSALPSGAVISGFT
jgi:hypothetical protein